VTLLIVTLSTVWTRFWIQSRNADSPYAVDDFADPYDNGEVTTREGVDERSPVKFTSMQAKDLMRVADIRVGDLSAHNNALLSTRDCCVVALALDKQ
jgi:hypothetical protein